MTVFEGHAVWCSANKTALGWAEVKEVNANSLQITLRGTDGLSFNLGMTPEEAKTLARHLNKLANLAIARRDQTA